MGRHGDTHRDTHTLTFHTPGGFPECSGWRGGCNDRTGHPACTARNQCVARLACDITRTSDESTETALRSVCPRYRYVSACQCVVSVSPTCTNERGSLCPGGPMSECQTSAGRRAAVAARCTGRRPNRCPQPGANPGSAGFPSDHEPVNILTWNASCGALHARAGAHHFNVLPLPATRGLQNPDIRHTTRPRLTMVRLHQRLTLCAVHLPPPKHVRLRDDCVCINASLRTVPADTRIRCKTRP